MALFHFNLGHIKRTAGHTAIAAAAYWAGEKLYDAYYGETQDYSRKKVLSLRKSTHRTMYRKDCVTAKHCGQRLSLTSIGRMPSLLTVWI